MSKNLRQTFLIIYVVFLFSSSVITAQAAEPVNYIPLEPSFLGLPTGSTGGITFGEYLTRFFSTVIGLAIILAVLMIVWGGFQYLSTDAITDKQEGKEKWTQAIYGLVLVLASYLILQTINKQIITIPNTILNPGNITSHRVEPIGSDAAMNEADRLANAQANRQISDINAKIEVAQTEEEAIDLLNQAEQVKQTRLDEQKTAHIADTQSFFATEFPKLQENFSNGLKNQVATNRVAILEKLKELTTFLDRNGYGADADRIHQETVARLNQYPN
ncbi:MAG: hypothetical protein WC250_03590 [Candidatus Paceibacterota bacterium]